METYSPWALASRDLPRWPAALAVLAIPAVAMADGGGPILILAGPVVFLVAQVWIIAVEIFVLGHIAPALGWREAWKDVVAANLRSYVQIGILLPIAITVAGPLVGGALGWVVTKLGYTDIGARMGEFAAGLSGWIYDSEDAVAGLPYGLVIWFVATYFLSVRVEGRVLRRRWAERAFTCDVAPMRASWIINAASYAGLSVGVVWILFQFFRSRSAA